MANMLGAGGRGAAADRRSPHDVIFEEIVPSSGWTEDKDRHCLIIDLPGFKMDEVKLRADNYGHLLVSGERQVNGIKHIRFQQSYRVPDNSDIQEATAKFEDEILYMIIPKTATAENESNREKDTVPQTDHIQEESQQKNDSDRDHQVIDNDQDEIDNHQRTEKGSSEEPKKEEDCDGEHEEEFHDARKESVRNESSLLETLRLQLKKNKGIVVTAVLAFSLGVFVCQKFQTNPEN
ncbi:inactive protein RESTRICTED TEV MOVEMENT 2-like [Coffea eugenioides]|uniref:inactive protein RESTRICTED TEV MOVEMENT 2-like n=1 Tax=Coffea eugenioides TaxID=49369 RepID=UPI000F60EC75|nr:inactive protein RESTRICTED TEV MOVEMENT 2-like [Coffea eugenioides]XP_027169110.1 inactive protein RESTRICTED TEV MOVEMENT 2-like [Coffea eugenioides]